MMNITLLKEKTVNLDRPYQEESVKLPALITAIAVLLIVAPLVWVLLRINDEGSKATRVSKYTALVDIVNFDVAHVDGLLGPQTEAAANRGDDKSVVTLIVPEIVLVDEVRQNPGADVPLAVQLDAIYWSPKNPIVGIGGEIYHEGDDVQGYEIVEIGKTKVHFKSRSGKIVIKDFYESLLQRKK